MNEKQAVNLVRNTIHVTRLGEEVARPAQRLLEQWLAEVAEMVRTMPSDETLFRQSRWRGMQLLLQQQLYPIDQQLHRDILSAAEDIPRQMRDAEAWMIENARQNIRDGVPAIESDWPYQRVDENSPMPPAALVERGYGEVVQFPGVSAQAAGTGPAGQPYFAPAQLVQVAEDTKVMGRSMDELFTPLSEVGLLRPPIRPRLGPEYGSQFIRRNLEIINSVVGRGFLLGETNEEIAKNLLSKGSARTKTEATTIARTAVQQQANDAHNKFWKANDDVIGGWEYDGTMDFAICPICSPYDGRTARRRADLPSTPQHPRCRCIVLPLTETEIRLREAEGPQRRTVNELVPGDKPKPNGAYARKVTVNGKRFWKVSRELQPKNNKPITMGEWMQDMLRRSEKSEGAAITLANTLGSGAGVERFRKALAAGQSPDAALVTATTAVRKRPSVVNAGRVRSMLRSRPASAPLNTKTKFTDNR